MAGKSCQATGYSAQGMLLMGLRVGVTLAKGEGRQQVGAILQRQLHKSQTLPQVHHLLTCKKMSEHAGMQQNPSRHWALAGLAYALVGTAQSCILQYMLAMYLSWDRVFGK